MIKIKLMIEESLSRLLIELIYLKFLRGKDCSKYLLYLDLPNNIYKKIVFDKNTNVNIHYGSLQTTPLMVVINCILKVKILLSHPDIDVNTQDIYEFTALMFACELGNDLVIKLLLNRPDIDVSIKNVYGSTALVYAKTDKIKLLIKNHPSYVKVRNYD